MKSMFHKVLNSNRMIDRRKDLRSKSTTAEKILWEKLRNSKLGFKFKRQYSIMNYVVDFYCHKTKIAIELDGEIHRSRKEYDDYRTRYLKSLGVKELRFNNNEVSTDTNSVLTKIRQFLPSPEVRRGIEGEV